jgi:UDP-N-acetylmuramoyl-L-alanyl-D-glutamate--2,6-diaminopimelate ligase
LNSVLHTPQQAADWLRLRGAGALHADSRRVRSGDAFLAWPGAATDARRFVPQLLAAGASACLIEQQGSAALGLDLEDVRLARYDGLKAHAGPIAATFYGQPSAAMPVLAVTGTNGKTTTAWWLAQALSAAGRRCAVVGTLGIGEPGRMASNGLTTPDPVLLQGELRRLADEGCAACALEASSIGLAEARLAGLAIHTAIFTNFTQDHLDYHGTMESYWQAKAQLFDWPGLRAAVINVDDPRGVELARQLAQRTGLQLWTLSCRGDARLRASQIRPQGSAMAFDLHEGQRSATLCVPATGGYNVGNVLGVVGALRSLGLSFDQALAACAAISPVPGRMESFGGSGQPLAVVDYAHTPDALEQALLALRSVATERGGRLWVVFGCGGDRDRLKRPLMAAAAQRCADRLVLTSDNPRSEPAQAIVQEMLTGLSSQAHVLIETDRARAIGQALEQASDGDVVLVAGKGHEDYQELGGQRLPFSDRQQVLLALQARRSAKAAPQ